MQTVDVFEARTCFSALLDQVEKGEQVIITKYGHPVAKLVPTVSINRKRVRESIQRLKRFNQSNKLSGLDWKKLRDERRRYG